MSKLYSKLARVYHEMYQNIFDYKKEFKSYDKILKKHKAKKILEIGCGSGNLATYFIKSGYEYTGMDFSREMLKIAKEVEPRARFIPGDMRKIRLNEKFDAVLITGRSFTYMTTNKDVINALKSINKSLKSKGILLFDNFNAEVIFRKFKKKFVNTAKYNGRNYKRVSTNTFNLKTGWTWNWKAKYYIKEKGKVKTVDDFSVLRAFTEEELNLFLEISGFDILKSTKDLSSIMIEAKKVRQIS